MRRCAATSRPALETDIDPDVPRETRGHPGVTIDIKTAFHLAKAEARSLDLPIRAFSSGYQFDAIADRPELRSDCSRCKSLI